MERIRLSDHFTYLRLGRFVLPSIAMMVFTSIYGIVDGLFVSNFVGKTAFAAVNLIMPAIMLVSAVGFMLGTGGSALVGQMLGQGKREEANRTFTMLNGVLFLAGAMGSLLMAIFMPQITALLGGSGDLLEDAVIYGRLSMISMPMFMLQNSFQSFFVTAERPRLGLGVTIAAGAMNMIGDFLLIGVLGWGVEGAAVATVCSEYVGGLVPVIYFMRKNKSLLHFVPTGIDLAALRKSCTNGISEMMTNIAGSVLSMVYNLQLLRYLGEAGVAAYGVVMYVGFIFFAVFMGYMIGCAPLFSYNYGAENHGEMHNLYQKSIRLNIIAGMVLAVLSYVTSPILARIFVGYDPDLYVMTVHAMQIFSAAFLFGGFAVFGSGLFTALGNGKISAIISFMRTLIFQMICVMVLPLLFGANGIWWSSFMANLFSTLLTTWFLRRYKSRYGY